MIVYKIKNKINGKLYIGQTTQSLSQRWSQHKYNSKTQDTKLARAIRKYGIENFDISTIYKTDNYEDLNKKEENFIQEYNTIDCGYNLRVGGENSPRSEETKRKISKSHKGKKSPYVSESNKRRAGEKRDGTSRLGNTHARKKVYCETNGQTYESATIASQELNVSTRMIYDVAKGIRKSTKGYVFKYI